MKTWKEFIPVLKEEMYKRHWNQSELARRLGMSESDISLLLKDKRRPRYETCAKLAEVLGIPLFGQAVLDKPTTDVDTLKVALEQLSEEERAKVVLQLLRSLLR